MDQRLAPKWLRSQESLPGGVLDPATQVGHEELVNTRRRIWLVLGVLSATLLSSAQAWADELPADELPADEPPASDAGPIDLSEPATDSVDEPSDADVGVAATGEPPWIPSERRCGFTAGLLASGLLGVAEGYPNDALKINRAEFLTTTEFAAGGSAALWLGMAISDWFVFGLGGNYSLLSNGEIDFLAYGAGFHADIFPTYGLGGEWRELGVEAEAGFSLGTGVLRETGTTVFDAALASRVGVGLFYEGVRFSKISMGPYVGADVVWSPSAVRPAASIGWRSALYVGP